MRLSLAILRFNTSNNEFKDKIRPAKGISVVINEITIGSHNETAIIGYLIL